MIWFEYAPADADAFEELLYTFQKTEEWNYIDIEIDIRLKNSLGIEFKKAFEINQRLLKQIVKKILF